LNSVAIAQLAEEVMVRCRTLASFSEDVVGTRRTFLSAPMRECHLEISRWLGELGLSARVDAAGNMRTIYPAIDPAAPRLLLGSHLDTVPNAGAYDGVLGVVLAVALLQALRERRLPFGIEVVGFSDEEGVRFGIPFIGSRALTGRIDDELLARTDATGVSVRKAIQNFGLNPNELEQATLKDGVLGYLEFHIEQGPLLERLNKPLGVVDAIVGQSRVQLTFTGRANHAGTTPMDMRQDAVAGAAEWITDVERLARSVPGLVATVGSMEVKPGATNVIAGEVRLSLDVRHRVDDIRTRTVNDLVRRAGEVAEARGLSAGRNILLNQSAVPMDSFLTGQIEEAIRKAGCEPHHMVSGAGHDAMILAERVPAAMIFLRCPGGISHEPMESVAVADVAKAIECGIHLLDQLASSAVFQTRTCRA
jgi:allantoate deiminase